MVLILKKLAQGYFWIFNDLRDPRSDGFFLMSSPFVPTVIMLFYLYVVYRLGPKFMEKRKPFNLERVMQIFNLVQVLVNGYLVYHAFFEFFRISWDCALVDYSDDPHAIFTHRLVYVYFLTKVADLLDTVNRSSMKTYGYGHCCDSIITRTKDYGVVHPSTKTHKTVKVDLVILMAITPLQIFFLLRKRYRQISFLHVYHHFGMVFVTWVGFKFLAGGHSLFMGGFNAFVHAVMYFYYLLTSLRPEYKNSIWWKKHITQLQLVQFISFVIIYGRLLFKTDCAYPKIASYFFVPQNFFMMILFGDFYYKTYVRPKKVPSTDQAQKAH